MGKQPFNDLIDDIELAWITEGRSFGQPSRADLCVTGQPYVELTAETPRLDKGMAHVAGRGIFDSYSRNRPGALYWHTQPAIERVRNGRYWAYRVTMKLLITDNPVVSRLLAEAHQEMPVYE